MFLYDILMHSIYIYNSKDQKAVELSYGHPVSNVYMIGDSIYSDIMGANQLGWETILIRSSLNRRLYDNAKEGNPAKFVVRDFEEAIKLIFNREGIVAPITDRTHRE